MKKIFTLLVVSLFTMSLSAASYGIMINGTDYHAGTLNPNPLDASFQEYQVLGVSVPAGATLQLYDADNKAGWAVDLDQASVAAITRDGDHYACSAAGCYDFYIKLKMNADQLYIGACSGGGEESSSSYGIMINGTDYHAGELNSSPLDPSFKEYQVLGVTVPAEATLQLYDADNKAGWAVDLDPASVAAITRDGDHYTCSAAGCYDFYIKLKMNADQLYIGACSGEKPDPQPSGDAYWYWKGHVDGVDLNNEIEGGLFDGGISEIAVSDKGYIFVVYQVHGVPGVQYMTDGWLGEDITHATMTNCGTCPNGDRLFLPAGNHTLYLYDNGDGTVELSREQLPGKTLVGGGQGIENTKVMPSAGKVIIDGQLRIVYGDKIFDATGRQL